MSSNLFRIVEHIQPCQHIRDYPRATLNEQEAVLHIAVKQYIPLSNPDPQPGDVTILGAHANGFPKELYEPLWDEILLRSKKAGFRIRSIWIADVAQQGQSGILNENLLGNEPSWNDHARDLLHLINTKRDEMPRPIVGIGHSMGGCQLVNVAYMHPRLLTALVLIDPVILAGSSTPPGRGPSPALLSTYRRDIWPSRDAVAQSFKTSKFYQKWDPRVLDRWIQFGLRDLPTPLHPEDNTLDEKKKVTLTTTKHQELFTFFRPNYDGYGSKLPINRQTHADLNPAVKTIYPFYRAEPPQAFFHLPELRPSVFYIFGGESDVNTPDNCKAKTEMTGIGVGGSGGEKAGRVKSVTFEGVGHLIAMEATDRTAEVSCEWLGSELSRWKNDEEEFRREWASKSVRERQTIDDKWIKHIGPLPVKERPVAKL